MKKYPEITKVDIFDPSNGGRQILLNGVRDVTIEIRDDTMIIYCIGDPDDKDVDLDHYLNDNGD